MSKEKPETLKEWAEANLWIHCKENFKSLLEAIWPFDQDMIEALRTMAFYIFYLFVLLTFPISIPIISYYLREKDRAQVREEFIDKL